MTRPYSIPNPSVERLCRLLALCQELAADGVVSVSSRQLAGRLGVTAEIVRKDINYLGDTGRAGVQYSPQRLRGQIADVLGLDGVRPACVVGLGRLGSALLHYERLMEGGVRVVAGFDTSVNLLETIRTPVPVYAAREIPDVVRRERIEVGLLAVPAPAAQASAEALVAGGVSGILNFAPVVVQVNMPGVVVRNVDIVNELRVVLAVRSQTTRTDADTTSERSV
jgi:redox-sensing transcriptional repressor